MNQLKKRPQISGEESYYQRLTLRNTFINILLFVIPFIILFFLINNRVSTIIKDQIYDRLSDTVEENIQTIQTFLHDREIDLKSYARLDIQSIEEVSRFSSFLQSLIREKKWYDFIFISDLEGNIVLSINRELRGNISDREYFKASRKGEPFTSGIFYSEFIEAPAMVLSHPLYNEESQILGVMGASLNLKNFYDLLFELRKSETNELFLVNHEGVLLSPTKLGGQIFTDKGYKSGDSNPHTGEEGVKSHLDYRGQKVLCAYKKIPQLEFYLVSEIDLKEALLPLRETNRNILFVFLPFFIILLFISNIYSRRITALLRKLTKDLEFALQEARQKKKEADSINIELQEKIKEGKRLTKELKISEEYIRDLIDSISLGVTGLDPDGKVTHFNKEMKEIFNITDENKGDNIFSLLPWMDTPALREAFTEVLKTGQAKRIEEISFEQKGEKIFLNLSLFPIHSPSGNTSGVTLLVENITERKKLREQLAEYEKLSALSQLALGAAHEINNPLLGISSYLELLLDQAKDKKGKEEIEFVLSSVYRISETIRGLLNFARPTPPQFTKVNINQLIEDTLSFLSHQPIFRKINIIKTLAPSLPQITADLNQIRQVLINIFINAAQSMPEGGEMKVATSKIKFKEWIQIDISDTGPGISQENLKKIFNPFFTTKKNEGTGLGLSISLSYIKNHRGDILVQSELGRGTTFSILLPIRQKGKVPAKDEELIS